MAEIKKTANPASEPAKAMKKEEKAANETAATKTKPAPKKIDGRPGDVRAGCALLPGLFGKNS